MRSWFSSGVTGCETLELISEYGPTISTSASLSFGPFSGEGGYSHSSSKEIFKSTAGSLKIQVCMWILEMRSLENLEGGYTRKQMLFQRIKTRMLKLSARTPM